MVQYTKEWLNVIDTTFQGAAPAFFGTAEELRGAAVAFAAGFVTPACAQFKDSVVTEDATFEAADGSAQRVRIYKPSNAGPAAEESLIVYYHGGGWVCGTLELEEFEVYNMCLATGATCVNVEYRMGPEHVYPASHEDSWLGLQWALKRFSKAKKVVVAGNSAGGGLAASMAVRDRDSGSSKVTGQLLVVPVTAPKGQAPGVGETDSYKENVDAHILPVKAMTNFFDLYNPKNDKSPDLFPLLNESLKGLPKAFILTCERDPLRDDGILYSKALEKAGVQVHSHLDRDLPHDHWIANYAGSHGKDHIQLMTEQAKWLLS